eukprot:3320514-Pleurochrysis_carterae.AAC.1
MQQPAAQGSSSIHAAAVGVGVVAGAAQRGSASSAVTAMRRRTVVTKRTALMRTAVMMRRVGRVKTLVIE